MLTVALRPFSIHKLNIVRNETQVPADVETNLGFTNHLFNHGAAAVSRAP